MAHCNTLLLILRKYFLWVRGGGWGWVEVYFGWTWVGEHFLWVGGCRWGQMETFGQVEQVDIFMGEWECVGVGGIIFWVSGHGCMFFYRQVGVSGSSWRYILSGQGQVSTFCGWVTVTGDGWRYILGKWGFVNIFYE